MAKYARGGPVKGGSGSVDVPWLLDREWVISAKGELREVYTIREMKPNA